MYWHAGTGVLWWQRLGRFGRADTTRLKARQDVVKPEPKVIAAGFVTECGDFCCQAAQTSHFDDSH